MSKILGIHYGHDATVVFMENGKILEAMSEERLTRLKKYTGFPHKSLAYIKDKYKIDRPDQVVVVGKNPAWDSVIFVSEEDNRKGRIGAVRLGDHFLRALGVRFPWLGQVILLRDKWNIFNERFLTKKKVENFLKNIFPDNEIIRIEHHAAHAWCAPLFLEDKTKKIIILTLDGVGDDIAGSISVYDNGVIERKSVVLIDASVGMLYSAMTDFLGMSRNEHEFKVMGLAPYAKVSSGEKVYQKLKDLLWFDEEKMTIVSKIPQENAVAYATHYFIAHNFHHYRFDSLAYGIQKLTEELIKDMARAAIKKYETGNIAVGGGVFMNVKANQFLLELPEVTSLTVVPSCGDESLALGACAYGYSVLNKNNLSGLKRVERLYLGSEYSNEHIKRTIDSMKESLKNSVVTFFDTTKGECIERKVAELLSQNHVVGRLKGRAEWGARALGNRSILANPMSRDNVKLINEMIKGRDFWMPFATSLLYEDRDMYLHVTKGHFAPYMAITFNTKEKAHTDIIAALHPYDLTSRPQMVTKEMNPEYHNLISHFKSLTGSSGILNTSFNLHGEPNVETPEDAIRTFLNSGLLYVAVGDFLLEKKK